MEKWFMLLLLVVVCCCRQTDAQLKADQLLTDNFVNPIGLEIMCRGFPGSSATLKTIRYRLPMRYVL